MLSKEQLEKIVNLGPVDVGGTQSPIVTEMAVELLSLREQLEVLKALEPVEWADMPFSFADLNSMHGDAFANGYVRGWERKSESVSMKGPLFTAAKPAED